MKIYMQMADEDPEDRMVEDGEDATSTTYITDGVEKLREGGYIGFENGEFVKVHDWLYSDGERWRFCIVCGRREHYNMFTNEWMQHGKVEIKEVEI